MRHAIGFRYIECSHRVAALISFKTAGQGFRQALSSATAGGDKRKLAAAIENHKINLGTDEVPRFMCLVRLTRFERATPAFGVQFFQLLVVVMDWRKMLYFACLLGFVRAI